MDYNDSGYRLLGLFRLWNAMVYYFPYMDILDDDWNELLLEHIPMMLNGTDKRSYESTLASLALKLDDAHVRFSGAAISAINERRVQALEKNFIPSPTIDFRQYPSDFLPYSLANYLLDVRQPFSVVSAPSMFIPGVFADEAPLNSGPVSDDELDEVWQAYLDLSEDEIEETRALYLEYRNLR